MRRRIPRRRITIRIAARIHQHRPGRERLDRHRLRQHPAAEIQRLDVHVRREPSRLPHGLEARLGRRRLRRVGTVLGAGGPEAPLGDLGGAVPADVHVGAGGVGFGVGPEGGLVDGGRGPVELEGAVGADAVGAEVGEPDGFAVLGVLGHGGHDAPADKGVAAGQDLHAALAGGGDGGAGRVVLVEDGGGVGGGIDGDDHA